MKSPMRGSCTSATPSCCCTVASLTALWWLRVSALWAAARSILLLSGHAHAGEVCNPAGEVCNPVYRDQAPWTADEIANQ